MDDNATENNNMPPLLDFVQLAEEPHYVHQGELQAKRTLKGQHLSFLSDVFGHAIAQQGNIHIAENLSGGSAEALGGNVVVKQRILSAKIRAYEGNVAVPYADTSSLVARHISVDHAINCELVADTVEADRLEGCLVIARCINIKRAEERRDNETHVTLLLPDLSAIDRQLEDWKQQLLGLQQSFNLVRAQMDGLKQQAEFAKYLLLHENINKKQPELTARQQLRWEEMQQQHGENFELWLTQRQQAMQLRTQFDTLKTARNRLQQQRQAKVKGVLCRINKVAGKTTVKAMLADYGMEYFRYKSASEIRENIYNAEQLKILLFSGDYGQLDWTYDGPETLHKQKGVQ